MKDCESKQEAQDLTNLLALIDVAAEQNEYEKAAKLVNIHENRIRNDPISTEVSISGAKTEQNDGNARQYLTVPYRDKGFVMGLLIMGNLGVEKQAWQKECDCIDYKSRPTRTN